MMRSRLSKLFLRVTADPAFLEVYVHLVHVRPHPFVPLLMKHSQLWGLNKC